MRVLRDPAALDSHERLWCLLLVTGAAYALGSLVAPQLFAGLVACPVNWSLGLNCPGCGLTRASIQCLRGNPIDAIGCNPLILLVAPFLAFKIASILSILVLKRQLVSEWPRAISSTYQWTFIILILTLAIVRTATWIHPALNPSDFGMPTDIH